MIFFSRISNLILTTISLFYNWIFFITHIRIYAVYHVILRHSTSAMQDVQNVFHQHIITIYQGCVDLMWLSVLRYSIGNIFILKTI